jgi:hypothetical protein
LVVLLLVIVGLADVLQHTPLAVMGAPPSLVTSPPLTAEFAVTEVTEAVVTVGATGASGLVVNVSSFP